MGRIFFALYRETKDDAGRVNPDPYGLFSCVEWVAKFLEIEDKAFNGTIYSKEREYKNARAKTRVDGTTIELSPENSDGKNAGTRIALQRKVGPRRAIIKTWKKIQGSSNKKATHEISFAFPSWATVRVISDALGEIIPENKISATSTENKIPPQWKLERGGTYGITPRPTAVSDTSAETSLDKLKSKVQAKGGEVVK